MLRMISLSIALCLAMGAQAQERTMIVLDASGSMWGQIDGKTKVEIAREVLATVLPDMPAETELGLVVYGHRTKGDCADIEVAVEPAAGTGQAIIDFANDTQFLGKTPLTQSVKLAAEALRFTEEKSTVVLVTDGLETCGGDPCALGAELEAAGVDFTAHVVGFGLTEEEGKSVACLADSTGGKYLPASDAAQLTEALKTTVVVKAEPAPEPAPPPEPKPTAIVENLVASVSLADGSPDLGDGEVRWQVFPFTEDTSTVDPIVSEYSGLLKTQVAPGDYVVRVEAGKAVSEQKVTLTADQLTDLHIVLNAAAIALKGVRAEGAEESDSIYVEIGQGDVHEFGYGHARTYMPAGEIVLKGSSGKAEATRTITVVAGESYDETIIIGSGLVAAKALYAAGGPEVEGDGIFFEVMSPQANIDGNREVIAYRYAAGQMEIPAGDYVLTASIGGVVMMSEPYSVKAGEVTEVAIVLNAGVAQVTANNSEFIQFFGAEKDISGNRKEFGYFYDDVAQTTLPAGTYVALVQYSDDKPDVELPFEVKAGQRVEVAAE